MISNRRQTYVFFSIIVILCIIVFVHNNDRCRRIGFLLPFIIKSSKYSSYRDWATFCQGYLDTGHKQPHHQHDEPHFILLNHIKSHEYMGSFLSSTLVVGDKPCRIVCYDDYRHFVYWPISSVINTILQDEIRIKKNMNPLKKEQQLVNKIKIAFSKQYNVVMFIESHKGNTVNIRSLYKSVLLQFPHVYKQYYQLLEPRQNSVRQFEYNTFPPTLSLDNIINIRTNIVDSAKYNNNIYRCYNSVYKKVI
jgi:hypothetical protein